MPHPRDQNFWESALPRASRSRLVSALKLELLGPESEDEVLTESPLTKYVTGMLAPFGSSVPEEEHDEALTGGGEDEESGAVDTLAPMSQALSPSSIGLSFLLPLTATEVRLDVSWGEYEVLEVPRSSETVEAGGEEIAEGAETSSADERGQDKKKNRRRPDLRWVRKAYRIDDVRLTLERDAGLKTRRLLTDDEIRLEHLTRVVGERLAVSVFIVNRRPLGDAKRASLGKWIFQPVLVVTPGLAEERFLPRDLEPFAPDTDRDMESNRLLFRNRREFAVGHGCAADWDRQATHEAAQLKTDLLPTHELPRIESPDFEDLNLDMSVLAAVRTGEELHSILDPLLAGYERWIAKKRSLTTVPKDLHPVATWHLDQCDEALDRMKNGLELIASGDSELRAFRFANEAMLLQRSHTVWAGLRKAGGDQEAPTMAGSWFPFQIGFFLLNAAGLIDPMSDDREIGDLLWFPTGGGKTEAYLGLAAFTLALRRLRTVGGYRTDAGVTVLMRYTLRLLTLQQFQRAATLLCACEVIRKRDTDRWGDYRFSIGLWLGRDGSPNSHDDARRALAKVQNDPSEEGPNPCVIEACPWCGETVTPADYWTDSESRRIRVHCPRENCEFSDTRNSEGLPVLAVDEEIYRECPSMLLGTVDKFAQMAWNGNVASIFGRIERECDRCGFLTPSSDHVKAHKGDNVLVTPSEPLAPPELVIQDELHLIAGPLGTLVGLYETAVDLLASSNYAGTVIRPKVIASTATVRRAFEQVQAIFDRRLSVFPPPGLEPEDSFFAKEVPPSDKSPGRLYFGVNAPGRSLKTAYIRVAGSLLSSGKGLAEFDSKLAEPFMTMVSYFNSLRELGGAIRLLDDDIPARLYQLKTAGLPGRNRPVYQELTSRIRQEEIPVLLRRLEQRHDAPRSASDPWPLDVVLASNMISVGVDINRLGLMTVTGQPKTTAEYIQATSRVGRQLWAPGLVVTLYNWSRPRDLSHFERFRHYHSTLYRNVEAVSATPFSSRALDRGLRGSFVSATRLTTPGWSTEAGAGAFDAKAPEVLLVLKEFRRRAAQIAGMERADEVAQALLGLCDEWTGYSKLPLRYGWRSPDPASAPPEDVLLRVPEGGRLGHWPAPQSLREVEETSLVRVRGLGGG